FVAAEARDEHGGVAQVAADGDGGHRHQAQGLAVDLPLQDVGDLPLQQLADAARALRLLVQRVVLRALSRASDRPAGDAPGAGRDVLYPANQRLTFSSTSS